MKAFNGFNSLAEAQAAGMTAQKSTPVPAAFFSELLSELNDADEIKLVLWVFKLLDLQKGSLRYLTLEDFRGQSLLLAGFGSGEKDQQNRLEKALESLVRRAVLLTARQGEERLFFLNSANGRATLEALEKGGWKPEDGGRGPVTIERPNIFALYEQNIGPLTPILADGLRDAEQQYPEDWIRDAFRIAVNNNARSWNYIEAILRSWKEKGRDERDQRTSKENRKLDSEGQFGEFVRH